MKKLNNISILPKTLGRFTLGLGLLMAFLFTALNSTAQCNISADFTFATDGLTTKLKDNSRGVHKVLGWTFGDGNGVRNDSTVKHTYAKGGTYKVCLIIYGRFDQKNNRRCLDTICKRVTVKDPCANLKAGFNHRINKNQVIFGANKVKGAKFTWSFGDGSSRTSGRFAKHMYKKPGTYEVCLQVKTKDCVKKVCKKVTIKDPCDRIREDFAIRLDGNVAYFMAQKIRGAKYTWGYGDGGKRGNGRVSKHQYAKPGTYKVCLQIKTKDCTKLICKRVVVKDPCDRIKKDFAVRLDGGLAYFKAQSIVGARYTWSFGDGSMSGYGKSVKHKFKPGTYKVCLKIVTKNCKKLICKRVTIKDPCDSIKADFAVRYDGSVAYFKAPAYKGAKYTWVFGDGGKRGYGNPIRHQYTKPGTYTVCLQIKTRTCTQLVCKKITIKTPCDRLEADFRFTMDVKTVKFDSKNSNGEYFSWSFGDGNTSRDEDVKHTYAKSGTYKVCLTVWTKDRKCKKTICKEVTIKGPCDNLKADFRFAIDGNKVKFESKNSEAAYFKWSFGDETYAKGENAKHEYKKPGTYKVCLTVWTKDEKCKFTVCHKVVVKDPCDRIVAIFKTKINHGKVLLEARAIKGAKYTWIFGDGSGRDTGRVVDHKYTRPGKYTVCMQVQVGNCIKKICKTIEIKSCNGTISFYPNPAHCLTQVKHNVGTTNRMIISDIYGSKVHSATNVPNNSILDVTSFRAGVYIVTITDSNGNVAMQRLIKKN